MGKCLSRTSVALRSNILSTPLVILRSLLAISFALLSSISDSAAHPVAQGHGELSCSSTEIILDLAVSEEQVSVWDTFRSNRNDDEPVLEAHGSYILERLRGRIEGNEIKPSNVSLLSHQLEPAFHIYHISFRRPPLESVCSIGLSQDFLREFEFAPGNPWEAIYSIRIKRDGGRTDTLLLASNAELVVDLSSPETSSSATFTSYFFHGISHILAGYDHILFVIALVLGVSSFWRVLVVISVFTVAHSLTLLLSVFDVVRLPSSIVEPMVAGSIVVVALMNVVNTFRSSHIESLAHRLIPTFFFGLFHGLGFAGGLLANLPEGETTTIALALLGFAGGVEAGHQIVIIPLLGFFIVCRSLKENVGAKSLEMKVRRYISLVVICLGMLYFAHSISLFS